MPASEAITAILDQLETHLYNLQAVDITAVAQDFHAETLAAIEEALAWVDGEAVEDPEFILLLRERAEAIDLRVGLFFRAMGQMNNMAGQIRNKYKAMGTLLNRLRIQGEIKQSLVDQTAFEFRLVLGSDGKPAIAIQIKDPAKTLRMFQEVSTKVKGLVSPSPMEGVLFTGQDWEQPLGDKNACYRVALSQNLGQLIELWTSDQDLENLTTPIMMQLVLSSLLTGREREALRGFEACLQSKQPSRAIEQHGAYLIDAWQKLQKAIVKDFPKKCRQALEELKQQATDLRRIFGEAAWPMVAAQAGAANDLVIKIDLRSKRHPLRTQIFKDSYNAYVASQIKELNQEYACYIKANVNRDYERRILFYAGPTNSGKSYQAFETLASYENGAYLAPLRLLALEGQEEINKRGHECSLLTGEESDLRSGAKFIAQTVETFRRNETYECVIIDEIQMIGDPARGPAFLEALVSMNAYNIVLTGSPDALPIVQKIAEALGDRLEVRRLQRKQPLQFLPRPLNRHSQLDSGTAIIAFSRRSVLAIRESLLKNGYRVSVIYGGLSPLSRRKEAQRFRQGQSQILVATDAIGMGLNLPIKTVLFSESHKFDGFETRPLHPQEIIQIGGRAGRFNVVEEFGHVGTIRGFNRYFDDKVIQKGFEKAEGDDEAIDSAYASLGYNQMAKAMKQLPDLTPAAVMEKLSASFEFENPWLVKCHTKIQDLEEKAFLIEASLKKLGLSPRSLMEQFGFGLFFRLINAPIDHSRPGSDFPYYLRGLLRDLFEQPGAEIAFPEAHFRINHHNLQEAESTVKSLTAYYWFRGLMERIRRSDLDSIRSFQEPQDIIMEERDQLSLAIARYLAKGKAR